MNDGWCAGLSTYRELCAIASDKNKPDLIYKFMQLAKHNAVWTSVLHVVAAAHNTSSSRRGAAFGFSRIARLAHEQLQPHLAVLIPRLYRCYCTCP